MSQSSVDESEISPNNAVGIVFGDDHSERVLTMGMGAAPTNAFRNTKFWLNHLNLSPHEAATSGSSDEWKEKYLKLEHVLKGYMIMKEGRIPEEFAGFFSSQSQAFDAASQPTSPLDARRSSDGSNANQGP